MFPGHWEQDRINRRYMAERREEPQTVTFDLAVEFLRNNHAADPWLLQIETFDPHEPFAAPLEHRERYGLSDEDTVYEWPPYRQVSETEEEIDRVRRSHAAVITACDSNLGRLLDVMDELSLWQDTLLIVNSDHGLLLGEHGWWGKGAPLKADGPPEYNETAHIPLFVWDPRSRTAGARRASLLSLIDLPVTLLEYFEIAIPSDMLGMSIAGAVANDSDLHDAVLFGIFGGHVNVTDGRFVYMRGPIKRSNEPLFEYTLMPSRIRHAFETEVLRRATLSPSFSFTKGCRLLRVPSSHAPNAYQAGTRLYDLANDPHQLAPIEDPELEDQMIQHLVRLMRSHDAPREQYVRLGLPAPPS